MIRSNKPSKTKIPLRFALATVNDAKHISSLILPLVKKFISHDYPPKGEQTMLNAMSESAIRANLAGDCRYLLATTSVKGVTTLVGVLGVKGNDHLYHLFVAENYHGQGVGEALWRECLHQFSAQHFRVNASRYAIGFYQHLGFVARDAAWEKNGVTCYPMDFERPADNQ
jgi:GNAT superfamily N-acetyltransferase